VDIPSRTANFWRKALALAAVSVLALVGTPGQAALWSTGYYPGYRQSYYAPSNIDFTALSHVIHFSARPNSSGTLNTSTESITPAYSTDLVSRAHAAGAKVLICVGGSSSQAGFQGATTNTHLSTFITNIVNLMSTYGYDGVDLDWEPLADADTAQFTNLVNGLRSALNGFSPHRLLTVATASQPALFASLQGQFDQINLMTYDMAGPWSGWVTWFNAPIFDGGYRFKSTGNLIPSGDGMVTNFIGNGVAPGKLALGIAFYGDIWTSGAGTSTGGALLPRQSWTNAPTVTPVEYFTVMASYYQSNLYHWDSAAQAAYLSITNSVATNDIFLSYDDEHTCQAKVSYSRNQGLGGVMIWEIGQGYRSTQPTGQRDPLLQAVKQALVARPNLTGIRRLNQDIQLSFNSLPLALYRVLWTSNLNAGAWSTLTNNLTGSGSTLQITDPGVAANQPRRFYRIQTPP
jgi:chitinase